MAVALYSSSSGKLLFVWCGRESDIEAGGVAGSVACFARESGADSIAGGGGGGGDECGLLAPLGAH
eukprot:5475058-Amphidinium_carterae.1